MYDAHSSEGEKARMLLNADGQEGMLDTNDLILYEATSESDVEVEK